MFFLDGRFIALAGCAYPVEVTRYAGIHQGLHSLRKNLLSGNQNEMVKFCFSVYMYNVFNKISQSALCACVHACVCVRARARVCVCVCVCVCVKVCRYVCIYTTQSLKSHLKRHAYCFLCFFLLSFVSQSIPIN